MAYTSPFRHLSSQLIFWFLLISLVPFAVDQILMYRTAESALRASTIGNLDALGRRQSAQIGAFVDTHWRNVTALSRGLTVEQAIEAYAGAFPEGMDSAAYAAADRVWRPRLVELQHSFAIRDLYLVTRGGDVVFSAERRADLGTNLLAGPYRDTTFAHVFDRANTLLLAEFSDYEHYPVIGEPAAFVAAPIIRDGRLGGVIVLLLDSDEILRITQDYTGLGTTGETLLIEHDGDEVVFATPTRHDPGAAFTRRVRVGAANSVASQLAARGYRGEGLATDYRGHETLAIWRYVPALSAGLVVKIDAAEAFAPIARLRDTALIIAAALTLVVLAAAVFVGRSISAPVTELTAETARIAAGDLERRVPVRTRNELGDLAAAFNDMTARLARSIVDLTETTRVKERMASELSVAHDIQIGILPKTFPAFPDRPEFDLHARLLPAREVGGDFYDFTLVNERELFFVVGDVSGKGVPGALFMAITRTLFKSSVGPGLDPSVILAKMNVDLCADNGPGMFVTVFCGRLDVRTGELAYANGGHNPPCLVRADGHVDFIPPQGSLVLAVMDDAAYTTDSLTLAEGDMVVAYTDGVNEAENHAQDQFGDDRLIATIARLHEATPADVTRVLALEVKAFADGAEQNDDITLLAVRYRGATTPSAASAPLA